MDSTNNNNNNNKESSSSSSSNCCCCSCDICTGACTNRPGFFAYGEAENTARSMGLTLKELFDKYLVVDWHSGAPEWGNSRNGEKYLILLAPATIHSNKGQEADQDPRGQCIFYDQKEQKCKIHEHGKPMECREYIHTMDHEQSIGLHNKTAHTWDSEEAKTQVKQLLGREPLIEDCDYY